MHDRRDWVQADAYYLWLHTAARAWMLRERMHRMQSRLESAGFLRVHRSAMVRRTAIVPLDTTQAAEPCLVLRSGARVRVARDRLTMVRDSLG